MNEFLMEDVRRKNKESGQYFFSPDTMKFFKSRVESGLIKGKYFITSEQNQDDDPRLFTVRKYDHKKHDIGTIGEFQGYKTMEEAGEDIEEME